MLKFEYIFIFLCRVFLLKEIDKKCLKLFSFFNDDIKRMYRNYEYLVLIVKKKKFIL